MKIPEEPENPFNINVVSMIDVIFCILAFLILSSLSLTHSEGLDVNLPQATTAKMQQNEQINVTIKVNGEIALNRRLIELNKLQNSVQQLLKTNTSSVVIINADKQVTHGRVVEVMDQLRQLEGVRLAIATEKP